MDNRKVKKLTYPSPPNLFKKNVENNKGMEFYKEVMEEINMKMDKETIEKGHRLIKLFEKLIKEWSGVKN